MTDLTVSPRRLVILGGSTHHPGGLEAYCERAASAVTLHMRGWAADWWPSETAYFSLRRTRHVRAVWRRAGQLDGIDLIWLQWSTLLDLFLLRRLRSQGIPILVTPHLGKAARLQRSPTLRRLCEHLPGDADHLGLLFEEQSNEIALPQSLPRSTVGTFLPVEALSAPSKSERSGPLHLIHAGRLSVEKGTLRMVDLCSALHSRGVRFTADIIGRADPEFMAILSAALLKAELSGSVKLKDWMGGDALRGALANADVLVHLSELDSFPLIVLEAIAAGTMPIVAQMAGAATMARRYNGQVSSGDNVSEVADWLAEQDLTSLRRGAAIAAERVRWDYDWARIATRLEDVFGRTLRSAEKCQNV